jgi:hypothetical protein
MKQIKLVGFLCGILLFSTFSCEKEEKVFPYGICVKGKVVGYEECGDGSLIQLLEIEFGDNIDYYDTATGEFISYDNIVSSPGIYPKGIIYFIARKYDSKIDYPLFLGDNPVPCQWIYGPYAKSIVVITDYSLIQCP